MDIQRHNEANYFSVNLQIHDYDTDNFIINITALQTVSPSL